MKQCVLYFKLIFLDVIGVNPGVWVATP